MKRLIHSNIRKSVKYIVLVIVIFSIAFLRMGRNKVNYDNLKSIKIKIDNYCNSMAEDIEKNEDEQIRLLEIKSNPIEKAINASALTLINTIKGEYDNILKYGDIAVENYLQVEGGEYYAIAEYKYIAWSMMRGGRFTDSFKTVNKLIDMLENGGQTLLNIDEVTEIEAIIHSIFVDIYSELKLPEKAKVYYNKLNEIEMTEELEISIGDRILYSKIVYANSIKDYELMKKYAEECYELIERTDKVKGIDRRVYALTDIAYANIRLGNYNEALEQLKRVEGYINKVEDIDILANMYNSYAIYNNKIENYELSLEYFDKSISLYEEIGDEHKLQFILKDTIELFEENKDYDLNKYYLLYYNINKKINSTDINRLLIETIQISEKINKSIIEEMDKIRKGNRNGGVFLFINVIILGVVIINIYILIKEKDKNKKILNEMARRDYLTGTYTRAFGEEYIAQIIRNNKRFSLGILDIDNFKKINDKYGHTFGDKVLVEVTKILKDEFDDNDLVIRFGGEEFIIIFNDKNRERAKVELEEIKLKVNKLNLKEELIITFSAGIYEYNGQSYYEIFKEADKLLYEAKNKGRDKIILGGYYK